MANVYSVPNWSSGITINTNTSATGNYFVNTTSSSNTWITSAPTATTSALTYARLQNTMNQFYTQRALYPAYPAQRTAEDPRILNKFLNASDLLGEFIKDIGDLGIKQAGVLKIPIELFVNWLIVKSAEEDGKTEEVKDIQKLPAVESLNLFRRDRCRQCGKFITRAKVKAELFFCSPEHFSKAVAQC